MPSEYITLEDVHLNQMQANMCPLDKLNKVNDKVAKPEARVEELEGDAEIEPIIHFAIDSGRI